MHDGEADEEPHGPEVPVARQLEAAEQRGFPDWVEVDTKAMKGVYKTVPERSELPADIREQLVIALYSK